MWKKIQEEEPKINHSKYLETDLSFSRTTLYKSKPIIIYAAQQDPWCPNVFYLGYWIEEVTEMLEPPSLTKTVRYFSSVDPWVKNMDDYHDTCNDIEYWDYYTGDMPNFE